MRHGCGQSRSCSKASSADRSRANCYKNGQIQARTLERFQAKWNPDCSRTYGLITALCGTTPPQERYYFLAFALVAGVGAAAGVGLRLGCAFGAAGTICRAPESSG